MSNWIEIMEKSPLEEEEEEIESIDRERYGKTGKFIYRLHFVKC